MVWFVIALIVFVVGLVTFGVCFRNHRVAVAKEAERKQEGRSVGYGQSRYDGEYRFFGLVGLAVAVVGAALVIPSLFYTQDVGEAKVQVSWTGELVGYSAEPGIHLKAPWVNVRTFDVRNNLVSYVGGGDENYAGNATAGPQITFQDREGVTGNMDLTVRYSIQGDSVLEVYSNYQTQESFVSKVISENVRSEARKAPASRNTIEVYNDRAALGLDIQEGLAEKLRPLGVIIEDVSVQEVRYSGEVVNRFDEAQAARIEIDRAEAQQEAAKVQADTKVIEAQGVAEANDILTQSLSEEILTQRYIDALQAGTVFVVPEGSTPLVTTGPNN